MPKSKSIYICSECGFESAKWYGKCPGCGEWNTMNEEFKEAVKHTASVLRPGESGRLKAAPILINEINTDDEQRYHTGLKELDRVLGGGIVKGSLVLLGGDPGIGKINDTAPGVPGIGKDAQDLICIRGGIQAPIKASSHSPGSKQRPPLYSNGNRCRVYHRGDTE